MDRVLDGLTKACAIEDGEGEGVRDERAEAEDVVITSVGGTMGCLTVSDNDDDNDVAVTPDATPTALVKSPTPLYVLYGSATGNAEHIAKEVASSYETRLRNNPSFSGTSPRQYAASSTSTRGSDSTNGPSV